MGSGGIVSVGCGDGDCVAVGSGDVVGEGVGSGDAVGEGVGSGDGVGVNVGGKAPGCAQISTSSRFQPAFTTLLSVSPMTQRR